MTLHFTPGDANHGLNSHHQAQWRAHHLVAYGSGNTLIVFSVSENRRRSLQTIYLAEDLTAVSINGQNGLIAISCGHTITIFKPVNEYMTVPKWTEALRVEPDGSRVNCVKWAPLEQELAVGSDKGLLLYHVTSEFGTVASKLRWSKQQPGPVEMLDITADSSKLISYTQTHFDSFAKVWMRLTYGDTTSLFDLVYADHGASKYLCHLQWRTRSLAGKNDLHSSALASMSHIKNIRTFMPSLSSEENDILYTVTNDKVLHVWATCDFNGHSYLKLWASYDLTSLLGSDYMGFVLIDGSHSAVRGYATGDFGNEDKEAGNEASIETRNEPQNEPQNSQNCNGGDTTLPNCGSQTTTNTPSADFLLLMGKKTTRLVQISNITSNPPNSISFDEVVKCKTEPSCIPRYSLDDVTIREQSLEEINFKSVPHQEFILERQISRFLIGCLPVAGTDAINTFHNHSTISFLVHDRVKSTLRAVDLDLKKQPSLTLREKFQGHGKSVKKLYTSSSSHEGNIMLSSSNFPDHNYIWEPFTIGDSEEPSMAITKRFKLDVTRDPHGNIHEQGIENAVILNDIYPPHNNSRHHLVAVIEKGGYLSLWDCDGKTMDDREASLVIRMEPSHDSTDKPPQTFFSMKVSESSHVLVAIYGSSRVEAWKVDIPLAEENAIGSSPKFTCAKIVVSELPCVDSEITRIAAVETYLEKDITSIDKDGRLRSFTPVFDQTSDILSWTETVSIQTNIQNASLIHGASIVRKTAIVNENGTSLSIWDSKTGILEYEEKFPEEYGPVKDLDWTFLGSIGSTANTLLAVGFSRFVLLYTQLRYDYTNQISTYVALKKIDISDYSSHEIGDSIWLDDSYLVISSGNQFFIDDKWVQFGKGSQALSNSSLSSTISQLLVGYKSKHSRFLISDLVRILNGPLPIYHPQFLIQALFMDETKLVEEVMVRLLRVLRNDSNITWNLELEVIDLLALKKSETHTNFLISEKTLSAHEDVFDTFNASVADLLSEKLTSMSLPLLTRHQQTTLRNLVILTNKLAPLRGSLDPNGMKFLYGFELFQSSHKQKKLTIRDINWAVHSDQKEMLFASIENHYHRLTWKSVQEAGLTYWVDVQRLKTTMESAARNEFADGRDPSGRVSILYLAIKKKQILLGLWRTVFHPEKDKVVKFLSNDFSEPRWQSAALKNAFVLLGKHRYMDAAYFFLLAGKVKDCCMTLCSKVREFELALAVARVNADEDALKTVLEQHILPEALKTGDRWTTSWAFWEMKHKEISIQALVMSPIDVITENADHFSEAFLKDFKNLEILTTSKSFLRVDPALGVLYQNLRESKLRYLQGSKHVLPETEFDFVIQLSTIYSRMGCDYLTLSLLRNWKFLNYSARREKIPESTSFKTAFSEFSETAKQQKIAPEPSAFVEPDMSAFSFGF